MRADTVELLKQVAANQQENVNMIKEGTRAFLEIQKQSMDALKASQQGLLSQMATLTDSITKLAHTPRIVVRHYLPKQVPIVSYLVVF